MVDGVVESVVTHTVGADTVVPELTLIKSIGPFCTIL